MEPHVYDSMYQLEQRHWWYQALSSAVQSAVGEAGAQAATALRVLDAGCGTGATAEKLKALYPRYTVIGLDSASRALAFARQRGLHDWVQGSVNQLPFASGVFDIVLLIDILYIQGIDEQKVLSEIRRVLCRGGRLILNVAAFESLRGEHDIAVHTRHRYVRKELNRLLAGAGFSVARLGYWNAWLFPALFLHRRLRLTRPKPGRARFDIRPVPGPLNALLAWIAKTDIALSRSVRWPFGSSLFAVAFKDGNQA